MSDIYELPPLAGTVVYGEVTSLVTQGVRDIDTAYVVVRTRDHVAVVVPLRDVKFADADGIVEVREWVEATWFKTQEAALYAAAEELRDWASKCLRIAEAAIATPPAPTE
jgi:hypothetical protein